MVALERLGLFGSAFPPVRTDMRPLYHLIFRAERVRDLSGGILALLALWRDKTTFSRLVIFCVTAQTGLRIYCAYLTKTWWLQAYSPSPQANLNGLDA